MGSVSAKIYLLFLIILHLRSLSCTIDAKQGVILSIKNHFDGYDPALHDAMAAPDIRESPM